MVDLLDLYLLIISRLWCLSDAKALLGDMNYDELCVIVILLP